ncbi:LysR family transcriptional regulator [Enterovibrio baiacu]|uniref:LysR family transcriptional regulator n=1 Tax=Enterovibrio baiacu TaxID=2491023 RepID=UPI0010133FA4|nr:LysR family transcriptional regulator [Enterovibrio baiacu]MBE1275037.1 LysR family transcriptional regulator [Enterovibrio baiacu]
MHTLEQLNAFIAVYEHGAYSTAAKMLTKSRTTVREHVMAYEDVLGYSLFEIQGRKAVPTDKAKQLYFYAKVVEKQNLALFAQSQALFNSDIHTLNIAYDVVVPIALMARVEGEVIAHYPTMKVNWLHRTRQEALMMLENGEADFALMPNRGEIFTEIDVTWQTLGDIKLRCYAGANSTLAKASLVTMALLQSETQYITENFINMNMRFTQVSPRLHVVSNSDLLCELVKHHGWTVMPEHTMTPYLKAGDIVEVSPKEAMAGVSIGLNVFYPRGKDNRAEFAHVIQWFAEASRDYLN